MDEGTKSPTPRPSQVWFTSDSHWGHNNIIKYARRLEFCTPEERSVIEAARQWDDLGRRGGLERLGQGDRTEYEAAQAALRNLHPSDESTQRMDEALIANWNKAVSPGDIVYHLGDIFLYHDVQKARRTLARLNGTIRLITGNHDRVALQMKDAFDWVKDYYEAKVDDQDADRGVRRIVLAHYAMRVWNHSHRGAWHLYGHSHNTLPDLPDSLSLDVGVDCHDYRPLSYQQVKRLMARKTYRPVDHHT